MIKKPIAISMGEPSGVSTEIVLKTWMTRKKNKLDPFFLIDDIHKVKSIINRFKFDLNVEKINDLSDVGRIFQNKLPLYDINHKIKFVLGKPDKKNSPFILNSIKECVRFVLNNEAKAMITLPVCKKTLRESGFKFNGQTEYIAHLSKIFLKKKKNEIMIMSTKKPADKGKNLIVGLYSTHEPLKKVINKINSKKFSEKITTFRDSLIKIWNIKKPRIGICGINPHAGEGGLIGDEEKKIIIPVINNLKKKNFLIDGPLSSDTCFFKNKREDYDGIFCIYHDQALIPIKVLDFFHSINVTGGLPFLRVSPDHGPAFDIAKKNIANFQSLLSSLKFISNFKK